MGSVEHDEREERVRFPVGGERNKVYNFLRDHGFVMSDWSDKHWDRADGITLHVYGSGSRAIIRNVDGTMLVDDALETAIATLAKRQS